MKKYRVVAGRVSGRSDSSKKEDYTKQEAKQIAEYFNMLSDADTEYVVQVKDGTHWKQLSKRELEDDSI